jgi:succinyl-diaminopimelate desuccinylase
MKNPIETIKDTETLALAQALISKPSVSPKDEGCQDLMIQRLAAMGFDITPMPFADVENFWALKDSGIPGPTLVFAGHTDVVPAGPLTDWTFPPFEGTVSDGWLYGRGSADMKSALAAMIIACERFIHQQGDFIGKIGFLITSDEEAAAKHGTVRVMQALADAKIHFDYCVVGEPSSAQTLGDMIRVGRRGSLNAHLVIRGKSGHVAYPDTLVNPIHQAMPAINALACKQWDQGNDFFPPTTFQVSNFNAGVGVQNVVPGDAQVEFNFRYSSASTQADLIGQTEAILTAHGLDFEITWALSGEPFLTEKGRLIDAAVATLRAITDQEVILSTGGGTSDGRFIAPYGIELIELGLVNKTIHKVNERVRVEDLAVLTTIYTDLLVRLVGSHD